MLPCDLNLNIGKTKGCNNKILASNTGMKIGLNRDINKDHKKLLVTPPDEPKTVIPAVPHDLVGATKYHNLKMLTKSIVMKN